jgi:hypothetical protein
MQLKKRNDNKKEEGGGGGRERDQGASKTNAETRAQNLSTQQIAGSQQQ